MRKFINLPKLFIFYSFQIIQFQKPKNTWNQVIACAGWGRGEIIIEVAFFLLYSRVRRSNGSSKRGQIFSAKEIVWRKFFSSFFVCKQQERNENVVLALNFFFCSCICAAEAYCLEKSRFPFRQQILADLHSNEIYFRVRRGEKIFNLIRHVVVVKSRFALDHSLHFLFTRPALSFHGLLFRLTRR